MVLSDRTISRLLEEGRIGIDPYDEALLQPSSVDVRVDRYFRVFHNAATRSSTSGSAGGAHRARRDRGRAAFILHPGEFVLGSTLERIKLPDDLVARLEGKSWPRAARAPDPLDGGFIDPGWDGHVTLELSNVANLPITIYGMRSGRSRSSRKSPSRRRRRTARASSGRYQGQRGPTPRRYWQNFTREPTR